MKKNDVMLIALIFIVAIVFYFMYHVFTEEGDKVIVTVDGEEYGTYDLNEDQIIEINDTNILEIHGGEAYMIEAECPDGLCLHQSAISKDNESIICLPNRVVVEVESIEGAEYDAIAQ